MARLRRAPARQDAPARQGGHFQSAGLEMQMGRCRFCTRAPARDNNRQFEHERDYEHEQEDLAEIICENLRNLWLISGFVRARSSTG